MRDNGGCEITNLDFENAKNVGIQWDFDYNGNPVPWPRENDLFKTYKVENKIYFTITAIRTNQEDLIEMTVYIFDIMVEGKFKTHGSVTSKIAYTSVNDCYDAALIFIQSNWNTIHDYFEIDETNSKPDYNPFHPTLTENESKIGKYYYTIDESGKWDNKNILIKHLH